jgi:hypothetical protein
MKSMTWGFRACLCLLTICGFSTGLFSQGFPPAQGPPLPPDPPLQFATSVLINFVKTTVQISLDATNMKEYDHGFTDAKRQS